MIILRTDSDRFGIRARLLTLLLPAILGLLALDSWNDYRALNRLVQDSYDESLLESAQLLRSSLAPGPDGVLRLTAPFTAQTATAGGGHKYLHAALMPTTGPSLNLLGPNDLPSPPAPPAPGAETPLRYDGFYGGEPVRLVALQDTLRDSAGRTTLLTVQVAESTLARDRALADSVQQALLRDARMVLVLVVLVWLGVTWSLRPLERLRRSVLDSHGRELQPLDTTDVPHEVAPLVDAVNQHVTSYRALLAQQSQFLADASHQLRTPLAIMLTQAGVALREKDPERLRETLRAIVAQIARSRRLCEQLLSLAHASESQDPVDGVAMVDLNTVAREVVLQYLTLAHEKNQDLGWTDARGEATDHPCEPAVPVLASAPELHEVLSNLVHNAIAYTPAGGSITVMARIAGGSALAEVRDDGPGIPAARREQVFERLHHGARGAGLGLAIARAYARRNGGDIELGDAPNDGAETGAGETAGLCAVLRLPLATAVHA
jgi:two-component system sensor histidine kinase TctE